MSDDQRRRDARDVLVRIIVPRSDEERERVIEATNSQTVVPLASLRAMAPIHRRIETFLELHELYYDRKKNYQKNRGKPRDSTIPVGYLSQAVMAILLRRPNDSRARPSNLLKEDADYDEIFNSEYPLDLYRVCIRVIKGTEAYLKSVSDPIVQSNKNNVKWHLAMFATCVKLQTSRLRAHHIAELAVSDLTIDHFDLCFSHVWQVFSDLTTELGTPDRVGKSNEFVTRLLSRIRDIQAGGITL